MQCKRGFLLYCYAAGPSPPTLAGCQPAVHLPSWSAVMLNSGQAQFLGNGFWQHKLAQILVPVSLSASQKLLGGN
jgi:hypothetical protein